MSLFLRLTLLGALLVSGGLALVYQLTWARMLYPVFGMHLSSISVVVATFLAGLGAGALLVGRHVDRSALPFRLYGSLEIGIGLYALCLPDLTAWLSPVYASLSPLDAPPVLDHVIRVIGVFVLLFVPCTLIGATFPAFAKGYLRSAPHIGRELGLLYALNTIGAAAGCLLAGTVLMQSPVSWIVYGTACGNILLGILFWMFAPRLTRQSLSTPQPQPTAIDLHTKSRPGHAKVILTIALLTGYLSLSFEILWTRALIPVIGATYVSFSLILSSMLIGMTLGTALFRWRLHRADPPRLLAALCSLLLLVVLLSFLGVFYLAQVLPEIRALLPISSEPAAQIIAPFLLCFLAFLPSSMVFGATFPLCLSLYTRAVDHVGTDVGRVYAVNTVGSVAGVLMTGLLIIEWLGSSGTLILLLVLNVSTIWVALRLLDEKARRLSFATAVLAAVGIALILVFPRDLFFAHQRAELKAQMPFVSKVVFQAEDANSMTTVAELQKSFRYVDDRSLKTKRHRWTLHSNRSYVGGTRIYLWNIIGGYFAGLLPPDPKSVLIIGYGSGRQTATMARLSHIEQIDVVEISALNFAASDYYYVDSDALSRDPRIRLIEGDGRNHLLRSRKQYDVIIVDVGGLTSNSSTFFYTREFLELCRARLNQNGYLFTWISAAALLEQQGWMYQNTFRSVFPSASVWYGTREETSFAWPWIIGVKGNMDIDYVALRRRWDALTKIQRTELRISGVQSPEDLLSLYAASLDDDVPDAIENARILTDDHPYHRPSWNGNESFASRGLENLTSLDASFRHFVDPQAGPFVRNLPASGSSTLRRSHLDFSNTVERRMFPMLVDILGRSLKTRRNAAEMLERYEQQVTAVEGRLAESEQASESTVAAALRTLINRPSRQKPEPRMTP